MKHDYPYSIAGTTASLLYIKDSQVFVANVGDSDIIMAIKNHKFGEHGEPPLKAVKLTEEHTPKSSKEQQRIKSLGISTKLHL